VTIVTLLVMLKLNFLHNQPPLCQNMLLLVFETLLLKRTIIEEDVTNETGELRIVFCMHCSRYVELDTDVLCAAVRYGRVPKRSLSADDQSLNTSESLEMQTMGVAESTAATLSPGDMTPLTGGSIESEEDIAAFENRQLAVFDVILSVAHSHTVHCDTTEDKVAALAKKPASLVELHFVCNMYSKCEFVICIVYRVDVKCWHVTP